MQTANTRIIENNKLEVFLEHVRNSPFGLFLPNKALLIVILHLHSYGYSHSECLDQNFIRLRSLQKRIPNMLLFLFLSLHTNLLHCGIQVNSDSLIHLAHTSINTQDKLDAYAALIEPRIYYHPFDDVPVHEMIDDGLELCYQESDSVCIAKFLLYKGIHRCNRGCLSEGKDYLNNALKYTKDTLMRQIILEQLSEYHTAIGNVDFGLQQKFIANEYYVQHGHHQRAMRSYFYLGREFCRMERDEAAFDAFDKALSYDDINNWLRAEIYTEKGIVYMFHQLPDSANYYFRKADQLIGDVPGVRLRNNVAWADLHNRLNDNARAQELFAKVMKDIAFDWTLEEDNIYALFYAIHLADIGKKAQALEILNRTDGTLIHSESANTVYSTWALKSSLYQKLEMYKEAFHTLEKYTSISLDHADAELRKNFDEVAEKYGSEEKKRRIAELKTAGQLADLKLKEARKFNVLLGIGLSLVFALLVYIYWQNQKISTQNKTIASALKVKEELLKEIHHRVKNNLQIITALFNMQARKSGNHLVKKALHQSESRLSSLALIHDNLYRNDQAIGVNIQSYFNSVMGNHHSKHEESDAPYLIVKTHIEELFLHIDTATPIGLILSEIKEALLYYHRALSHKYIELSLTFGKVNEQIVLTIMNNTKMEPGQSLSGLGEYDLWLCHMLARKLDASIEFNPYNPKTLELIINDFELL